jgi:NTP pyrophosphatase (non-canonical NTP hydrolase)
MTESEQAVAINTLAETVHAANAKWWVDINTGKPKDRNLGEMLLLCVSELIEAFEGARKDLMDDHLPHRKMLEVELADCIIRVLDVGAGLGLDVGGAFIEKMRYNAIRSDHKIENRLLPGGKKY